MRMKLCIMNSHVILFISFRSFFVVDFFSSLFFPFSISQRPLRIAIYRRLALAPHASISLLLTISLCVSRSMF